MEHLQQKIMQRPNVEIYNSRVQNAPSCIQDYRILFGDYYQTSTQSLKIFRLFIFSMLATLHMSDRLSFRSQALLAEQESGVSGKGQTLTEHILQIMEVILMEASSEPPEKYKVSEGHSRSIYSAVRILLNLIAKTRPCVLCSVPCFIAKTFKCC